MRNKRLWLARLLIGAVLLGNLQCALVFLWQPERYMAGFGLSGTAGAGILRALGLLFVMWNVPYAFALMHPVKNFTSLIEAAIMQAIGLIGEIAIFLTGNYQDQVISASVERFIFFDGIGIILLLIPTLLIRYYKNNYLI